MKAPGPPITSRRNTVEIGLERQDRQAVDADAARTASSRAAGRAAAVVGAVAGNIDDAARPPLNGSAETASWRGR